MKKVLFIFILFMFVATLIFFNQDRTTPNVLIKSIPKSKTEYVYQKHSLSKIKMLDKTIEYTLDEFNRYIDKKINRKLIEKYLWLENNKLLAILDKNNQVQISFEYKNKNDSLPYRMKKEEKLYYFIYNKMKSLKLIVTPEKKIIKIVNYDSNGNVTYDSNPSFFVPMNYAGGLLDKDTSLIYFKEGIYNPQIAQWITKIKDHNIIENLKELNSLPKNDVYECSMTLDTYFHSFLCVNGQCGGLYANDYLNYFNGTGEIVDNSNYFKKSQCKKINISKQNFNNEIFSQCIYKEIQPRKVKLFDAFRHNCHDEIRQIKNKCFEQAKFRGIK